ncbi:hypothetical protein DF044_26750 [Burkholderia contaminans]|uniref:Uncharacterized protein n=1 Tax=Burkholderia contaminans TaxID=488447 RepID=A0A3N8R3P6_9BURK|nr:hypothetical protein DF044_26750 [Burkholderia contaminans]RQT30000.1 hypothetical protein DF037_12995 [Burkholderia contaminans]
MAARHDAIGGLNATRARTSAAAPDVLKCQQRSVAIAAYAGVAAARVCPRDAARDAARTTHGRGRLAAPDMCNWSQS